MSAQDYRVGFATALNRDLAALRAQISASVSINRYESASDSGEDASYFDVLLLDLAHPASSLGRILRDPAFIHARHAVVLADRLGQLEDFALRRGPVERIIEHPRSVADFRRLGRLIGDLVDPESGKKFANAFFDRKNSLIDVTFRNGQFFKFPPMILEDIDATKIKKVRISRSSHELIIEQASGSKATVPWDVVRCQCDPAYPYYQSKPDPKLADRIARNIKALRSEKALSTYELAAKTGISRPNITRIETARTNPSLATLEKLAKALDVSPARLIA